MDLSMRISMVMSLLRQLLALCASNAMHDKEEKLLFIVFLTYKTYICVYVFSFFIHLADIKSTMHHFGNKRIFSGFVHSSVGRSMNSLPVRGVKSKHFSWLHLRGLHLR